jgi:PAS domain S-box-containing protein
MKFEDSVRYKQVVLRLRWITIIITSYLILFGRGLGFPGVTPSLVILFYLFSNIAAYFIPDSYFMRLPFFYIILLFDTFMVSLGIYITSQFDTDFYLAYFLIILIASIARSFKLLMINAIVISGIYGWLLCMKGWNIRSMEEGLLLRIPFIFIMNIFYGFLIQAYEERTRRIKKELKEVEESAQRYRQIVESAQDSVVILDEEERVRFFNKRFLQLTQYNQEDIIGRELGKIGEGKSFPEVGGAISKILNNGEGFQVIEAEILQRGGERRRVEVSAARFSVASDKVNIIVYLKDVTDRKKMEEGFIQSEKMRALGEMAAGISHYLNNVLCAILGRAQLLYLAIEEKEGGSFSLGCFQKELKVIEEAAKDGAQTIKKIQEFSRPKTKGSNFILLNVNEILKKTLELVETRIKYEAEEKGIYISVRMIEEEPGWVMGNPNELEQVFLNILFNSIDAMPGGGKIIIKTKRLDKQFLIEISDNGIGIPESIRNRIFDPFFTTKGVQRAGLGLSVSYGIIKRHRGEIEVESQEGLGTTFIIRLPIEEESKFSFGKKEMDEGGYVLNEYTCH